MVRDKKGRFAEGNGGGPGRSPKKREERFLEITRSKVTFKDWGEIIEKAVEQAKRGNPIARKFLADYLIGPPAQTINAQHSGPGGGPIETRDASGITDDERIARIAAILDTARARTTGQVD